MLKMIAYFYVTLDISDKTLRPYIDTLGLQYKCLNSSYVISFLFSQLEINESWMGLLFSSYPASPSDSFIDGREMAYFFRKEEAK